MNLARIGLPLIVLAAAAAISATLIALRPEVEPAVPEVLPPLVEVAPVRSESVQLVVRTHGTVMPRTESRIASEVAGRLMEVSPAWVPGGFFEAGEVLVRLDPTDYELAAREAEAVLAQAQLALVQEETEAAASRRDWEAEHPGAPAPPLAVREPQLRAARAAVEAARVRIEKASRDVERCTVRAPYPCRVRSTAADVGSFVAPGTELGRVYAIDAAEIRLPIPDRELAYLDLPLARRGATNGDALHLPEVELRARFAGADTVWRGRIVRSEGELAPESRMVVLVCRVDDPYGRAGGASGPPLTVGMFVEAAIEGRVVEDAIALPRRALRSADEVFVLEDGRLRFRRVDVLRSEEERVLLKSGVRPGERVIVSPIETPVDGMRVRAVDIADGGSE